MSIIMQLIVVAFLVEAIWETLKMTWEEGKVNIDNIGALVVGIIIAIALDLDLFIAIGLEPIINFIGVIAAGILISRGGNFIHDLMGKLKEVK